MGTNYKEMIDNGKNFYQKGRIEEDESLFIDDKNQRSGERAIIMDYLEKMNNDDNYKKLKNSLET